METDVEILTQISKEKFRRRIVITSRIIAVLLILAIIYIGYIQVVYVKDLNQLRSEHGSLAYCYMCGLENYRKCECQYIQPQYDSTFNLDELREQTAEYNIKKCENRNKMVDLNVKINNS